VSSTGVRERFTRVSPREFSRLRMRRLKAGWVTKRRSAAWEKLRVAARATKSSSHLVSMFITAPAIALAHASASGGIMPILHGPAINGIGLESSERPMVADIAVITAFRQIMEHHVLCCILPHRKRPAGHP